MQGNSRKTFTSASLISLKPLTVWITINCVKFFKEMGISDHLICLLRNLYASQEETVRNLYASQEETVRTGHRTDWFKIGK